MNIAICEDDEKAAEKLADLITDWANTRKIIVDIKCYSSAESFLMFWPDVSFDLAFIDIQMKNITGIQLAGIIRETDKSMMLVFITSFTQYALKGYEVDALQYLIKPMSPTKLLPILDKAHTIWVNSHRKFLVVSNSTGQFRLPLNDIFYITMLAHNAEISTLDNKHIMRKSAKELMELLPPCFIRCHRSYILNLYKVDCIYGDSVRLSNNEELPVSRSSIKQIKDAFYNLHMR